MSTTKWLLNYYMIIKTVSTPLSMLIISKKKAEASSDLADRPAVSRCLWWACGGDRTHWCQSPSAPHGPYRPTRPEWSTRQSGSRSDAEIQLLGTLWCAAPCAGDKLCEMAGLGLNGVMQKTPLSRIALPSFEWKSLPHPQMKIYYKQTWRGEAAWDESL